jgi:hypothetical protein
VTTWSRNCKPVSKLFQSLAAAKVETDQLKQGKAQAELELQRVKSRFERDLNIANTALVAPESANALKQISDSQSNHALQIAELQRQLSTASEKAQDLELKLVRANALLEAKGEAAVAIKR